MCKETKPVLSVLTDIFYIYACIFLNRIEVISRKMLTKSLKRSSHVHWAFIHG